MFNIVRATKLPSSDWQHRLNRCVIFIICTSLSFMAFAFTYKILTETSNGMVANIAIFIYKLVLFIAWLFYFKIAITWVKNGVVPMNLLRLGRLFGWASVAITLVIPALMVAAPAILLMLYIDVFANERRFEAFY